MVQSFVFTLFVGLFLLQNYHAKIRILKLQLRVERIKNAQEPVSQKNTEMLKIEEKLFILEQQVSYIKLLVAETSSK